MSGSGDNISHVLVGFKRTGKSTYIRRIIDQCYHPKQKILIVTQTDPEAYGKFRRAESESQLRAWKFGPVKYYNRKSRKQMLQTILDLAEDGILRNGAVIFEDATSYITGNPPDEILDFLINHRMYFLDLYFILHSLTDVPPKLWRNVTSVTVFKTAENESLIRERKMIPNLDKVLEAWKKVKTDPDMRKSITVSTGI